MTPPLRVAHLSDTHLSTDTADPRAAAGQRGWERTVAELALDPPDLVVHSGDLVLGDPDCAADRAHAARLVTSTGHPTLVVPGNHDVGDHADRPDLPAAWRGKPVTEERCRRFRAVWGPDRWAVVRGGWLLIGLNSLVLGSDLAAEHEQWEWLAETGGRWPGPAAVFLHEPLILDNAHTRDTWAMPPTAARHRLIELLDTTAARTKLVASGHLHRFRDVTRRPRGASPDPCRHVTAPSTAYPISAQPGMPQPTGDPRPGYVRYTLHGNGSVEVQPRVLP